MATVVRLAEQNWQQPAQIAFADTPKSGRRVQIYVGMALTDVVAITAGFALAGILWQQHILSEYVTDPLKGILPFYLIAAAHRGSYSVAALHSWTRGLRAAISALFLAALAVVALGFLWKISSEFSRLTILSGVLFASVFLSATRRAMNSVAAASLPGGPLAEVVLTDAQGRYVGATQRVLDIRALGLAPRLDCPDSLDRLGRLLGNADRVVVDCALEDRQAWTFALKGAGVDVEILIPEVEQMGVLDINRHHGQLTAVVARGTLAMRQRILKRAFDLAFTFWLLPPLLLITVVVAVLIKLDDGGPVFFLQKRIGHRNRLFSMYKFRSMRAERLDATGARSTSRDDDRITKIGRFLRSTSLDELPQLFNVLRGDMSIVGPRPHAVASTAGNELFWAVDQRYWHRHAAKPGLTGLAQVRGFRGATETQADLINRVQSDLEYVSGWSLWRDLRILAATAKVVVHSNAY